MKDLNEIKLTTTQRKIKEAFNFESVEDVLTNYPIRYDCYEALPYSEWKIGETLRFEAITLGKSRSFGYGKKTIVHFEVMVEGQVIDVIIFNRPWAKTLPGQHVITIFGKYNGHNKFTAINYDLKAMKDHKPFEPIYRNKADFQQRSIHAFMEKVLSECLLEQEDTMPATFIDKYRLLSRTQALQSIHMPPNKRALNQAIRRLKYEEFLRFFAHLYLKNEDTYCEEKQKKNIKNDYIQSLIHQIPFVLTKDQGKVLKEMIQDMKSTKKMNRLIQGDVGSGKTVVAGISLFACVSSGYQAALLAPTEILARQHFESLQALFPKEKKKMTLLYSGLNASKKENILNDLKEGNIQIVIGTHSLLQSGVHFQNLGLVIVDEQQRFGVQQREFLKAQSDGVDFAVMSATPIPRTLASSLLGGMDVSTIQSMPKGRKAPITKRIEENSFRSVLKDIQSLLDKGHQLYVICAAVNKNENGFKVRNVYDTQKNLAKLFPNYQVGMIHGQMKSQEKEKVMQEFYDNQTQILVSTTVVEVGMNCVNATGMIIYDSDRFGLSTLHQLRGRIQRGNNQGYCWLLSDSQDELTIERLEVLVKSYDGFYISEEDLRLRGPGDILGLRQSGLPSFILGNLIEDTAFIDQAKLDAKSILDHPETQENQTFINSLLKERLKHGYS
ncbi:MULTISPECIES: ATP-dependent DNA helicase RecG [Terrabacteria group]|uniref:ATP-dependent DNA helicase RecG n=1 Tax=Bacillati TaxID=1783272 RepID=UPI001C6F3D54|nr:MULTISPECIES: ATP-dependent DNA helicase RecG [Terrabacteria group]MBW9211794.1 ATP-dependent DNA helicase RecG [Trueperella sp. zg.1013]